MKNPERLLDLITDQCAATDRATAERDAVVMQLQQLTAAIAGEPELAAIGAPVPAAIAVIRRLKAAKAKEEEEAT